MKKSAEKKKSNNLFADFFVSFRRVYLQTFFFYFLFLFVVAIYNKILSFFTYLAVSGMSYEGAIFDFTAQNFNSYLVLVQIPVVYLFFVFVAYVLFEMLNKKFRVSELFLVGLRQFVLFLFFFFVAYLGLIFYAVSESVFSIILFVILLILAAYFIFVMFPITIKNSLSVSFVRTLKQILNKKAGVNFLLSILFSVIVLTISSLFIAFEILPETLLYFVGPILLIFILYFSINAQN